jgi:hypothetical protein
MLWRIQHGLDPREERPVTVRVADDGRLSGTATAVRGALLVAEADGFTPAALPLAWNAEGVCDLRFSLRPSLRIVARVLDENGAPVAGDEVLLDTAIVTKDDDETARAMAMHPRGGVVYAGRAGQGTVGLIAREFTDARGIVRFDAPAVGVNVVRVLKPGYLVALREFTPDAKDAVGFDLRLARSEARVLVLDAGKPVASSGLMVCLEGGGQNGFQLSTDADGRMDPGWLERGRWYRTASGNWNVCFRWDGQTQIDLSELPKNPANK